MSAGGAFGGARGYQARPPEKGVFPLDHFGECKEWKEKYLHCLRANGSDAEACQNLSKEYLQCRMERNLMAKQDLKELGLEERRNNSLVGVGLSKEDVQGVNAKRKKTGFTAGLPRN